MNSDIEICNKYNASYTPVDANSIIGISKSVAEGVMPIHGLRHQISETTNGWYVWAGDYSDANDFFEPIHTHHLEKINKNLMKYLALPPGYRFLISNDGYEDIWFDENLMNP